jgi:hypothetical protein
MCPLEKEYSMINKMAHVVFGGFRSLVILGLFSVIGCSPNYRGVSYPHPNLNTLSPRLANLATSPLPPIPASLHVNWPATLAVAKVRVPYYEFSEPVNNIPRPAIAEMDSININEKQYWCKLVGSKDKAGELVLREVRFIEPATISGVPTLEKLRSAAKALRSDLLLIYIQQDSTDDGYNENASAYWTLVGMLAAPGHTVGSACTSQGAIVDVRTGLPLAASESHSMREEKIPEPGVAATRERLKPQTRAETVDRLQANFQRLLLQVKNSTE